MKQDFNLNIAWIVRILCGERKAGTPFLDCQLNKKENENVTSGHSFHSTIQRYAV